MSWQATAWAKATRGHRSHGEKLILFILADYANPDDWIAWPNIARLSNDAEMSERNVKRCLQSLESRSFIFRLQRGNQHVTSEYLLRGPGIDIANYFPDSIVGAIKSPTPESDISDTTTKIKSLTPEGDISNTVLDGEGDISDKSEGDISSTPIKEGVSTYIEPPSEKEPPEWWRILGRDKRWPKEYAADWGDTVGEQYGSPIDLETEAFKAVTWLGTTAKGLSRKPRGMKTFWLNWLARVAKDNQPAPSKARANTVQDVRKAKARRDGTT